MKLKVWDAPTRVCHLLFLVLLGVLWWTAQNRLIDWHIRVGYMLLAVLIFRLYWGFVGSSTARFAAFLRGPRDLLTYARTQLRVGTPYLEIGHNPIGGWSVLILLVLMLAEVLLGLFSVDIDGLYSGPLSSLVSFDIGRRCARLHHVVFDILVTFVCLHVAAVLVYLFYKRQNLITPMITGSVVLCADSIDHVQKPSFASVSRAIIGVVLSGVIAWVITLC